MTTDLSRAKGGQGFDDLLRFNADAHDLSDQAGDVTEIVFPVGVGLAFVSA
jgi:hypothetical protein